MSVKSIMFEIEGLIKNAVMSCAAMYGFSAEEALSKIDSNGNLIRAVVDKEAEKQRNKAKKDAEKAGKALIKQQKESLVRQQKAELASMKEEDVLSKAAEKDFLKQQKEEKKEALVKQKEVEKQQKQQKEAEKAELASMKEEDVLSKAAEKVFLKQKKEAEKPKKVEKAEKKTKKVVLIESAPVIKSTTEDDEPFIRFQNIPLMNEINSIREVKKFKNHKKLSAGVKLARQMLDI